MENNEFDYRQTNILNCLKEIHIEGFEKYDLSKLLFNVTGEAIRANFFVSMKRFVKAILNSSFEVVDAKEYEKEKPLVVSYDYKRRDHTTYWEKFKNIIRDYNELKIAACGFEWRHINSPKEIIIGLISYSRIKKKLSIINSKRIQSVLTSNIIELMRIEKRIASIQIDNRSAFIFFDGGRLENLVVQNLRNRGVIVAAMQHGQPVFHGMNCDRINQTMILNFSSDYIMVTGEFSKKQFMLGGIPEEKIFVGGSLRTVHPVRENVRSNFAVFLDCPTYPNASRDNQELLRYAEKIGDLLGTRYDIKCHPQDNPDSYQDSRVKNGLFAPQGVSISEVLEGKAFALLHASGVYLDIISEGIKAFCYVNNTEFPLVEEGLDSFETVEELNEKIKKWNYYKPIQKKEYMDKIVEYYLYPENVEQRYMNFVKLIASKEVEKN